ncbi:hypothetical protein RMN57_08335 [Kitasatospora sp. CM 4170]|uniref:Lipoprotein n=1 Tax=Kitasatospora aburaviensis TaxID=67265 RepID=A0ABW1ERT7_9ACTN|nr:hypothetical protein [Kitasatospora sp. CM 4170]WNM44723.1 hypothetical protein RMN57_08335 [Kitasatospora sp. CM 4170]
MRTNRTNRTARTARANRTAGTAVAAVAAIACLGALSACGPDNGGDQNAAPGKAASPAATAPAGGTATGTVAPQPSGGAAKPSAAGTSAAAGSRDVPAGTWINPRSIPLDATYHWPAPAGTAKSVAGAPTFKLQELCHSKLSPDTADLGTGRAAAQSLLGAGGPDQWQAQQTLLYEGDPRPSSGVAQSAHAVFSDLREEVKACAKSAPGATVKVTSPEDANYFAATVTVPQAGGNAVTLHEYLTAPDGTVNELAVWTTGKSGAQPKVPWAGPADADVAKAMDSALCTTLKDC